MSSAVQYVVGTSGYSFADWVGPFYPPGTRPGKMFAHYAARFEAVELNFTFYRLPAPATLERMARLSPPGFAFYLKANQLITHQRDRSVSRQFLDSLYPLQSQGKLAGVLLQFPQSFHRTVANRRYLAAALADFESVPTAVEFRHGSWEAPSTLAGLRDRNVALVVPDVPDLPDLFAPPATATTTTGYLRLHSRDAGKWYAGYADRYDYSYDESELKALAGEWSELADQVERVYAFFNNCHRGQAAQNAEAFRRIVGQLD